LKIIVKKTLINDLTLRIKLVTHEFAYQRVIYGYIN